jgi:mRNA-degrading endonuclease RelE of RelBE toxin-antitoxin system
MSAARRRLSLTKSAGKGIRALPEHVREACKNVLRELVAGGRRGKKLKGELSEMRSIRIGRSHRVLYVETEEEIRVVDVGPRGDIYKR